MNQTKPQEKPASPADPHATAPPVASGESPAAARPISAPPARRHLSWGLLALATTAVVVGLASYSGVGKLIWGGDPPPPATDPATTVDPSSPGEDEPAAVRETPEQRAQRRREAAIGRWRTYYKGDRFMTVRPDGTATIEANLVEYSWFEKQVVGTDKVTFEIEWQIDGDDLLFDTVGGSPKASVDVITTIHGKSKRYPLVHVTDEELRYKSDTPEEPDYVWTRMTEE